MLSPHLDDAVISVGGTIARAAAEGREVTVATVYTSGPRRDMVPRAFRRLLIYEQRKREDFDAITSLGAAPLWLDFHERATCRPSLHWKLGVFNLPLPASLQAFERLTPIQERISSLISGSPDAAVLVPFGVGAHVDHVETFLAALMVMLKSPDARTWARFQFYEDAYSLSARARRRHFAARRYVWRPWQSPLLGSIVATGMRKVMGRAARGPLLEEYLPAEARNLVWRCSRASVAGFEEAKLHAWSLYPSQVKGLGGLKAWEHMLSRYHSFWGGAEPIWRAEESSRDATVGPRP